jgi:thiol-disulfide isomerase/thioredoxin
MDPANDEADEPADQQPRAPGRPRLDRRTIAICVAIAAVAAVISAVVVAAMIQPDEGTADPTTTSSIPTIGESSTGPTSTEAPPPTLQPAEDAPDVEITRFDGSAFKLSDYRGQKLVVNFFASYCVPCKKEMPALQAVHQRLGDEVTFIGVAVQDDPDAAQELIEDTGVSYDLAQDRRGKLFTAAGATVLPATIFVAGDGTIMELQLGEMTEAEITQNISANLLAGG